MYSQKVVNETLHSTPVASLLLEEFRVSHLSATVKRELFQILGLLVKRAPRESELVSTAVEKLLFTEFFCEVEKQKSPQVPVVIGALKGITHLLHTVDSSPDTRKGF